MRRLVVAAVLLLADVAHAGDGEDQRRARQLYEQGLRDFDEGRYDAAIEAFDAAMDIAPSPALHYNIAQAYRLKGDCARALPAYRAYLREAPRAPNRQKVLARISEMQRCSATAERRAASPTEERNAAWQGKPAREDGPPSEEPATDESVEDEESDDPLLAPAEGEDKPDPQASRKLRLTGYIAVGAGALLLVGGYATSRRAADREAQIDRLFQTGGQWSAEYQNLENDGRNAATVSAVCYVAGAAAILTGGVLWWLGENTTERVQVSPMGRRGVSVAWRF